MIISSKSKPRIGKKTSIVEMTLLGRTIYIMGMCMISCSVRIIRKNALTVLPLYVMRYITIDNINTIIIVPVAFPILSRNCCVNDCVPSLLIGIYFRIFVVKFQVELLQVVLWSPNLWKSLPFSDPFLRLIIN